MVKNYEKLALDMIQNGMDPKAVADMPIGFLLSLTRERVEETETVNEEPVRMVSSFRDI